MEGRSLDARPGWWFIRGVEGEFYPCKPSVFAATYEDAGIAQEPTDAIVPAEVRAAREALDGYAAAEEDHFLVLHVKGAPISAAQCTHAAMTAREYRDTHYPETEGQA